MLRPLALIATVGMMATTSHVVIAQQTSGCPNCDNATVSTPVEWQYAECDDGSCQNGNSSLCSTKAWPDKGWNPPARRPVNRDGIWYQAYWPQAWYGNRGGEFISDVPMVYQPTDTTQLGYSYAKVPTWTNANMIPRTPCPANFHARVCVPRPVPGRRCIDGCPAGNPCQNRNCPSCQQGYTMNPAPGYGVQQTAMMPVQMTAAPVAQPAATQAARPIHQTSQRKKNNVFSLAGLRKLFD